MSLSLSACGSGSSQSAAAKTVSVFNLRPQDCLNPPKASVAPPAMVRFLAGWLALPPGNPALDKPGPRRDVPETSRPASIPAPVVARDQAGTVGFARALYRRPRRGHRQRRRLPGTEGWAVLQKILCPVCSEPNLITQDFCVRCGADLRPQPSPVFAPGPAPLDIGPEPAAGPKRDWLPLLVTAAFVLVCGAVWLVAGYVVY
jgi:hypothetical protein